MKIKKGDRVRVLTGKDRGKEGNVLMALPDDGKVIVEGVNVVHKHRKARSFQEPGRIHEQEMPIDASNVMLVHKGKPTRVGYRIQKDGTKVRVAKRSNEVIG